MIKTKRRQSKKWLEAEKCKKLQKKWGLDYDEFVRKPNKENKVAVIKALNDIVDKLDVDNTVLEVGCGAGHFMWAIKDKVSNLIGLDYSPYMLDLTREQFSKVGLKPELKLGSCWKLPFSSNYVDFSFSIDVNMHIGGSWEAIREMIRVSRQYVLFTGPSFDQFTNTMDQQKVKKKLKRGKRWGVSLPLLETNLQELRKKKVIVDYYFLERAPTSWFNHKILVIKK